MLASKKNTLLLILILFILSLSRIALYPIFGTGFVGTDAERRYLPQVDELSQSLGNFFSQIGPAYSLFLLLFKKITNDMVVGSVLVQHIIGVITGVLVFHYFKRVNLFLAAFVTIFVYSGWLALWLEHTILRDSLTAFFLVLLVLIFSLAIKQEKYFKLPYAFLAGFTGLILVLFRMELMLLVIFLPFVFFFAKKGKPLNFKFWDKRFLGWCLGYFLPLFVVILVFGAVLKNQEQKKIHYDSLFGVAYYSMAYHDFLPRIFYYENSRYPGLLEKYQSVLEIHKEELNNLTSLGGREKTSRTVNIVYKATEDYLFEHPEINLSVNQMMDRVYLEIIKRNTLIYLQGVVVNFKSHLVGMAEMHTVLAKSSQLTLLKIHLSGKEPRDVKDLKPVSIFDKAFRVYIAGMIIFSKILFWLFLISLPILFFKWKIMPPEVIVSFFVVFFQLSVLAIVADPSHRFRYPIDPFLYFLQLYLILYFLKTLSFKNIKLFLKKIAFSKT
jgi:4-amino-4-deoxy-L-arabinose transferase-like glycosyltransferase